MCTLPIIIIIITYTRKGVDLISAKAGGDVIEDLINVIMRVLQAASPRENPDKTVNSVDLTKHGSFPRPAVAEAEAALVPGASNGSSRLTEDEGVMG